MKTLFICLILAFDGVAFASEHHYRIMFFVKGNDNRQTMVVEASDSSVAVKVFKQLVPDSKYVGYREID